MRRSLSRLSVALLVVGLGAAPALAWTMSDSGAVVASYATSTCPTGDTCATIPSKCPAQQTCPTVEVGPTSELGSDQWVYIKLSNFNPADEVRIEYCQNVKPLSVATPLCAVEGSQDFPNPQDTLKLFSDGTMELSFHVGEEAYPDPPFQDGNAGSFYCDGASQACSVDVVDPALDPNNIPGTPDPLNAAVIPVSFAPASSGCPAATTVNSISEFGIENLLGEAARLSCAGPDPSVAFNSAIDGLTAVTDLAQGTTQVAFTDDPESAAQQAQLSKGSFGLIPIALTANVIGYQAIMASGGVGYPDNSIDLTPNMVAGFVSYDYSTEENTDLVPCRPSGCADPPKCISHFGVVPSNAPPRTVGDCSVFTQLDYQSGFFPPSQYGAYVRSDQSGVTDQMFKWICNAPNLPIDATTRVIHDKNTVLDTLEDGFKAFNHPVTSCPDTDLFPALPVLAGQNLFEGNTPNQQVLKMENFVLPPGFNSPQHAGFAPMNWAEAVYYGLDVANLQNASGAFVAPTEQSIDAALKDATVNKDGTLSVTYDDRANTEAYPMPSIIYAAVPTTGLDPSTEASMAAMLTQLLNLTGGADTADLPGGFVPLTSALYAQAKADIAKDLGGSGSSTTTTTTEATGPTGPSRVSSPTPSTGYVAGGGACCASSGGSSTQVVHVYPNSNLAHESEFAPHLPAVTSATSNTSLLGPGGPVFSLVSSGSRLLLPIALVLGPLALILGALLLVSAGVRRSLAQGMAKAGSAGRRANAWLARPADAPKSSRTRSPGDRGRPRRF